jgi:WD40 repeat protein
VYREHVRGDEAYDVFLSYSRADWAAAETLRARLEEAGLSAFLDRYSLPAGQPWQPWLECHLASCRALVVLVGGAFGEWQQREIQLGLDRQASAEKTGQRFPVIPVLLPGLGKDDIPVGRFLGLNTWVDLRSSLDEPEALQRLVSGAHGGAIDAIAASNLIVSLSPYRGLMPFREQDAGLFFGRKRFVDELVRKVRQRRDTNVVAVVGRSGSGKSSIVYAGLIPALRRERGLSEQSVWQILDLRPYDEPLHQLATAFDPRKDGQGLLAYRTVLNEHAELFRQGKVTLAEVIRDRLRMETGSTRLLLYVDQWEELYTQAMPREIKSDADRLRVADAKLFIDLVLEAAAKSPCTLVLSVRSDFYPDIQSHDGLRVAVQESQISLGTMNEAELRDVIEGPPKALGTSVDPELTKRLARDIGLDPASGGSDEYDIGKLPLLEYALEQAWAKRTGPRIGLAAYSGLEQALEERANALFGRLSAEEQAAAKRLFVSLVTPGEGREDTRARIDMPDDEAMRRVIQTFAGGEARLVVTDEIGGRRSVEVSHEALIRHWDKLRAWIDENRDKLRTREFLRANRMEWVKHGRDPGLLRLPHLYVEQARGLHKQPGDVVIDDVKDYVEALLAQQERDREEAEAKQREALDRANEQAEEARRFADERARSEETQRLLRKEAEASAVEAKENASEARRQARRASVRSRIAAVMAGFFLALAAVSETLVANEQKAASIQNETGALALAALPIVGRSASPALATKLALAAWPRNASDGRHKLDIALAALSAAVLNLRERKVLSGHYGAVRSAAFSPDGARVVTASDDRTARVWDSVTGEAIAVLSGHGGAVLSAAFSADGKRVVTTSIDKTARVWDAATGNTIAVLSGHDDLVWTAAFSPDGARVVTASNDGRAQVWDAVTGKSIAFLSGHDGPVLSAAFSPDGARVVTASGDRTARVWDSVTGEAIAVLSGHGGAVLSAAFSPNGARIATASKDKTAGLWDAVTGKPIAVLSGHGGPVLRAAFSPDGARIVTASDDKTARVWDAAATGRPIAVLSGHGGAVLSAAFSPDGARVVTASSDKKARLWEATGRAIAIFVDHNDLVNSAAFSPDGARIVTASDDKTARVWDAVAPGTAIAVLGGHDGDVNRAAFSPDGKRVVTASNDKTARIWDAATGNTIAVLSGHDDGVNSAAFSPDGARVVTASNDKTARVWDPATSKAIAILGGHEGRVFSAAFSADGKRIVTASDDKTARVWDAATGKAITVLSDHGGAVSSAAFSPDGARVVTASWDNDARVWDAATGKQIAVLRGHGGAVLSAAFSPDGKRVVTASNDKTARIWDAATGNTIAVLSGHDDGVNNAAFSPDGARVVTASNDKTARVWDPATSKAIAILGGHEGRVFSAAFSADGKRIVTASDDKTARVWDVSAIPKGNLFQIVCAWLPDHDLTGVAKDYGLTNLDPICTGGEPLPEPLPQ